MQDRIWYHGTPYAFETFDPSRLGHGNDQLGSGFYFTENENTAVGYACKSENVNGRVIVAELDISNPLPATARLTRKQIEALLRSSTDFEEGISNWGEIGFEGEAVVVARAIDTYAELNAGCEDVLQVLNSISNDFWRGEEAAFLQTVRDVCGFDGLFRKSGDETHAVVWFPEQVRITEIREVAVPVAAMR